MVNKEEFFLSIDNDNNVRIMLDEEKVGHNLVQFLSSTVYVYPKFSFISSSSLTSFENELLLK